MLVVGWMFQNDKHCMPTFLRRSSPSYSECSEQPCEASTVGQTLLLIGIKKKSCCGEREICDSDLKRGVKKRQNVNEMSD